MALSNQQTVAQLYVAYFNRAPDPVGLKYWSAELANGVSVATIASSFAISAEAQAIYPYIGSDGSASSVFFVIALYNNLLGRDPDSAGLAYWMSLLQSGAVSAGQMVAQFVSALDAQPNTADSAVLTNKTTVALYYASEAASATSPLPANLASQILLNVTGNASTVTTAETTIVNIVSPPPVVIYVPPTAFTTGTDTLTITAASIGATLGASATLTANDSLHGSSTTLAITDSGASSQDILPTGLALTGVPTITLTTSGNAGTDASHTFDVSGFSSVTSLQMTSSGTHGDFITVGSGVAVTVTQNGSSTLSVAGAFASLAVTSNSLSTLSLSGNAGTVSLTDPSGPTSLTVDVTSFTTTGFTDASNHITSLSFSGSSGSPSTIKAITDTALTSITLSDGVTLGTDSSHLISLGSSITTVSGSSDNAANYLSVTAASAAVTLGNGNNFVTDNGGGATITVGTGSNTIDVQSHADTLHLGTDGNYGSAPTTPNIVVQNAAAGVGIHFSGISNLASYSLTNFSVTSAVDLINTLESDAAGSPLSAVAQSFGGHTYIVATATGTLSSTDTVVVDIVGVHAIGIVSGNIDLTS